MNYVTIDVRDIHVPDQVHEYLQHELDFPDYYGGNLDAFYDVLTDICEDTCIRLLCADDQDCPGFEYHQKIRQVLLDAAEMNPHLYLEI